MVVDNYYTLARSEVCAFLPNNYRTVLEVGCGAGSFSAQLASGCDLWGVEPEHNECFSAIAAGYNCLHGLYEEVQHKIPSNHFDLIICNDVIEHMIDPDSFFESIKDKMGPSGVLVGSIPNVRYWPNLKQLLFKKDWKYMDFGVLDRTHLRFFTKKSLLRIFEKHGFNVNQISGINEVTGSRNKTAIFFIQLFSGGGHNDLKFQQFGFQISRK